MVTSAERLTETADGVYLGGRRASIQNRVSVRGDLLTITTTATYDGASESIQRHEYRLRRAS